MNDTYAAEMRNRRERAHQIGLFRYQVIQDAVDLALTARQRGAVVRELAARTFTDPGGRQVSISRSSLDRWIRSWRSGGFEALVPPPVRAEPRTPPEVLALAAALKRENPARTATQVARILRAQSGWSPSERTLQRYFVRLGIAQAGSAVPREVFGRFEASRPNELWVGDALHGPRVAGRKTYLFAFLDDHSRAVAGSRFGLSEDVVRLAAALHPALSNNGVPAAVYVDNGSAFVDTWLLRACATLGIRLVHSRPGRPEGRGKSNVSSAACENSSSLRPAHCLIRSPIRVRACRSSAITSTPGWPRSVTAPSTPRPDRPPSSVTWPAIRRAACTATRCGRRSCGRSCAP
ncbi:DDE-type integrase/transposase/recombinase [Streptomyces sp. NPDC048384]|uniref:DDE-type integrase/transposase/recombinase n=1 Tax=Streptomyces sp. NPDC048384 TaxID=3155487 RepID=UPI00344626EB